MKAICKIISVISLGLNLTLVWAVVNESLNGILAFVILVFAVIINMMVTFFAGYLDGADSKCKHKGKSGKKNTENKIVVEDKAVFEKFGV